MRSTGQTRSDLMALRALISNGVSTVTGKLDTLESSLSLVATSGSYSDLTDAPTLSAVATSGVYSDLSGKPTLGALASLDSITTAKISNWSSATSGFLTASSLTPYAKTADLATVATTGAYSDLSGKPTIPTVPSNISAFTNDVGYLTQHQSLAAYAKTADLSAVALSGAYSDLSGTPDLSAYALSTDLDDYLPLAGGNVSGVTVFTANQSNGHLKRNNTSGYLLFSGGSSVNAGAALSLSGSTRSSLEGYFRLTARSSSSTYAMLEGRPDGTLTWDDSNVLTEANTAPTEIPLTDAGYAEFTALNAWRTGNVVQVLLSFRTPATAPTDWTTIASGLPAPMAQLITIANTWTASYSRPVRLSVETDGTVKAINGKANIAYSIVFSYVTSESA